MMPSAGRPTPEERRHHAHRQPVKAFARLHYAYHPLKVVVAACTLPPQHRHRKGPDAPRSATSSPDHLGDTELATQTEKGGGAGQPWPWPAKATPSLAAAL
jgi:hypothetical protein